MLRVTTPKSEEGAIPAATTAMPNPKEVSRPHPGAAKVKAAKSLPTGIPAEEDAEANDQAANPTTIRGTIRGTTQKRSHESHFFHITAPERGHDAIAFVFLLWQSLCRN